MCRRPTNRIDLVTMLNRWSESELPNLPQDIAIYRYPVIPENLDDNSACQLIWLVEYNPIEQPMVQRRAWLRTTYGFGTEDLLGKIQQVEIGDNSPLIEMIQNIMAQ